jgi:hypothetical protein
MSAISEIVRLLRKTGCDWRKVKVTRLTHFGRAGNFVFSPNLTGAVTTKLTNMSLILAIFHTIRRARRKLDSHL